MYTSSLIAVSAAVVVLASPLSTNSQTEHVPLLRSSLPQFAPMYSSSHEIVNNSYIVILKQDTPLNLVANHLNFLQAAHAADPFVSSSSGLKHVYDTHINGYAGVFTDNVVEQIRQMPEVDFVERDSIVTTMDPVVEEQKIVVQKGSPWGLARISHRKPLSLGTFNRYEYDAEGGEGVDVYVVDTGINIAHVEFQGRAYWGKTIPQNDLDIDGNGHGTHCAGTIASRAYGVAKKANVIAVKVLGTNGSGSMSDVIAGVDYVSKEAKAKAEQAKAEFARTGKTSHKGSVANMSLGGGKSRALDLAVNNAVKNGVHFAVAAGNDNKNACDYSPAGAELAVTVGASTLTDERAYFSNHGKCVDVFAPGLNIKSTWNNGDKATNVISGTSMASPHVAGLLAYYLSIYPARTFDPDLATFVPSILLSQEASSAWSIYSIAYNALPSFISEFLPSPAFVRAVVAPIPSFPTISTSQLKAAVIALSTKDALIDLPKDTVNYLVFNNATSS